MEVIVFIVGSFLVCLPAYIYIQYVGGDDLLLRDLLAMFFIAMVPIFNIFLLICLIVKDMSNAGTLNKCILKGKK